jgi:mRNA interferase RelE/StbE
MKTDFKSSFLSDIKKIRNKTLLNQIEHAIIAVEAAENLQDIPHLKKLNGGKKNIYYRIKINNYRIGVTIEHETVTFVVFGNRKDIYRYFP